ELRSAYEDYGVTGTAVIERNGLKLGFFGLEGIDSIECIQTDLAWTNYIEAAKAAAAELESQSCDVIIALSHSGTNGDGKTGEDFDLAAAVPAIDVIISGHTHTAYPEPVMAGGTLIASAGCYLQYLGRIDLRMGENGPELAGYTLIPISADIPEDPGIAADFRSYKKQIEDTYLAAEDVSFDQVIARSRFDMISLDEMYATHQEYTTGDLIADSYIYEAERNGIGDIDVALVGLGTIRGSIRKGDITVSDAFEICSLGVGSDGSAGHPLLAAYITGKELKLLTELDASLGPVVSSIKMSYSGLRYAFNTKRILLDRVTDVKLVRGVLSGEGSFEEIDDKKLYKVCCNMYAANMLGMLNGLTKGVLSITPKDAEGKPIEDFYAVALKNRDGAEIKEWVAFKNYLMSLPPGADGVPEIPAAYSGQMGRKVRYEQGGLAVISHPGTATKLVPTAILCAAILILMIVLLAVRLVKRLRGRARKANERARRG
ncbi:MAG: 5'-nucleotidase C-terminal domain-containing protein, partial [Firmicutes bacterium]|nr:5'-nucleotidase C-terminal domain-containing protein [Bacillota bacterium]